MVGLHQSAGRVCHESLTHNAVLQGDVFGCCPLAVGIDREGFIQSPGERTVVENHVCAVGNARTVLAAAAFVSHTEPHVTDDDVFCTRERHAVSIHGDAFTGSRLSGNIEVSGKYDAAVDVNYSCHIEHNDAVGTAHGIP